MNESARSFKYAEGVGKRGFEALSTSFGFSKRCPTQTLSSKAFSIDIIGTESELKMERKLWGALRLALRLLSTYPYRMISITTRR